MVQYFKGLKDIVVADVMQVSVRTKAMHHATSVACVLEKRAADLE